MGDKAGRKSHYQLLLATLCGGGLLVVLLFRLEVSRITNGRSLNDQGAQWNMQGSSLRNSPLAEELIRLREANNQMLELLTFMEKLKESKSLLEAQVGYETEPLTAMYEEELEKQKSLIHDWWIAQNASLATALQAKLDAQKMQLLDEVGKQMQGDSETLLNQARATEIEIRADNLLAGQKPRSPQASIFGTLPAKFTFTKPQISTREEVEAQRNWTSAQWKAATMDMFAANRLEGGYVMLCLANSGMKEFVMNMIASLVRNSYSTFVIICYDFDLYRFLCEYGFMENAVMLPSEWANMEVASGNVMWKSKGYNRMLLAKMKIVAEMLKLGVSIFHIDVDLVFLSPYVFSSIWLQYGQAAESMPELIFQCDTSKAYPATMSKLTCMLHSKQLTNLGAIDGGFWLARPTPTIQRFFNLTLQKLLANPSYVAQIAMNEVMHKAIGLTVDSKVASGFSPLFFPGGWVTLGKKFSQTVGVYPLIFHANWLVGNVQKKEALKSLNMWYIGEDFA